MVFTGTYEHAIDAKHRLAVPSELRRQVQRQGGLGEGDPVVLYATVGGEGVLLLYTEDVFARLADELNASDMEPEELAAYEELFYTQSRPTELDKQGRVRLPAELLEQTGLSGEVVVLGVKDHIEVRDRGAWRRRLEELRAKRAGMSLTMNPRWAMRRRAD
ncbi:MAG: hypothetical protein AAF797_09655 [Planctomycetota bacterium]